MDRFVVVHLLGIAHSVWDIAHLCAMVPESDSHLIEESKNQKNKIKSKNLLF